MKNLHDLFIVSVGMWLRVDDIYSFNNIYASTPFECIKQHFAKWGRNMNEVRLYKTTLRLLRKHDRCTQ